MTTIFSNKEHPQFAEQPYCIYLDALLNKLDAIVSLFAYARLLCLTLYLRVSRVIYFRVDLINDFIILRIKNTTTLSTYNLTF